MAKVAVGLSGGVDSSVAASLLIEMGHLVTGVYIEAYNEPGCRTDQDKKDALKVALQLGIPFETLDVRKEYKEKVIEYFYHEYEVGRTPNPDVVCNREIKFGIFFEWAISSGFDYVATGHYARIKNGLLARAHDLKKDQSYFLWQVRSENLKKVIFPLGEMTKHEVREEAKKRGLVTFNKPDSMGVCMMGQLSMNELLRSKLGEKRGEVIYKGQIVGEHSGLWFHTIGERKGFVLDKKKMKKLGMNPESMPPLYVIDKNIEVNQLVVGTKEEVKKKSLRIEGLKLSANNQKLYVRIRNLGELYEIRNIEGEIVTTVEEMEGVASGQSAVIYQDTGIVGEEVVVGGGEIR